MAQRLSQKGLEFIVRFEGFRGKPYNDPVGHATIGYGHLLHHGKVTAADKKKWGTLSQKAALRLLRDDVVVYENCVRRLVKVSISQAQFDALVSFALNLGCGALERSALLRHLNEDDDPKKPPKPLAKDDRQKAADQFLRWNKATKDGKLVVVAGLTRRRRAERRLFLTGLYTDKPLPKAKPLVRFARGPSPNFTWNEVTRGRAGFTALLRARAILHARKVELLRAGVNALRKKHRLKPTSLNVLSWWRPRWYNVKIGGATDSRHIKADAIDIAREEIKRLCPWAGGTKDFDALADRIFAKGGFGQYPAGSRHVDSRGFKARWSDF